MNHLAVLPAISHHAALVDLQGALTVHRVFPSAWHLQHPHGWVISVTEAPYDGPLGVRLASGSLSGVPVYPGTRAWLGQMDLRVGPALISLAGSLPWTPRALDEAPPLSLTVLDRDIDQLSSRASVREADLNAFCLALVSADRVAIRAQVAFWTGRGPGLTPAGDDLLVGLLTGLGVVRRRSPMVRDWAEQVHAVLATAINRLGTESTTALSRTLLHFAVHAVAVEPLLHVLYTVGRGGPLAGLDTLAAIGHSSGRDMLSGALLALHATASRGRIVGSALVYPP